MISRPHSRARSRALALILFGVAVTARAENYQLPTALLQPPFNCTLAAGIYTCPSISLSKDAVLELRSPVTMVVNGDFDAAKSFTTLNNGNQLSLTVNGEATFQKNVTAQMTLVGNGPVTLAQGAHLTGTISVTGKLDIGMQANITGNITVTGSISTGMNSIFNGNINASEDLRIGKDTIFNGNSALSSGRDLSIDKGTILNGSINAGRDVLIDKNFTLNGSGAIKAGGDITIDQQASINGPIDAGDDLTIGQQLNFNGRQITTKGDASIGQNSGINGTLDIGGNLTVGKNSHINGNVFVDGDLDMNRNDPINGVCEVGGNYDHPRCKKATSATQHFHISHSGKGLACAPSTITVYACSGATTGASCPASSSAANGTLQVKNPNGAVIATQPIAIGAGQFSTTINVPFAGAYTVYFGTDTTGATCWNGSQASCEHKYSKAGFTFNVPNHLSATKQAGVVLSAVRLDEGSNTCAPAFSGKKSLSFSCIYVDPSTAAPTINGNLDTGSRPVKLDSAGASTDLTCGATGGNLDMNFDTNGQAKFDLTYTDVGKLALTADFAAAQMTGSSTFIAYPKSLGVSWPAPSTLVAGERFRVKVVARNANNNITPNYGRESTPQVALLSHRKCLPKIGEEGAFTGTLNIFKDGSPESDNSTWNEVGTLDVVAKSTSYLGVANVMEATSNTAVAPECTGLFGRFRPQHFKTELDQPYTWAYSGQPFRVKVIGFSQGGTKTKNYNVADGFHQNITFSAWGVAPDPVAENPASGAVAPAPVPKNSLGDTKESDGTFAEGAVVGSPSYTFDAAKLPVKPTKISVRAVSEGATSEGHGEATIEIRTARLRMSNAFGSVDRDLKVPVRVEYWTGNSWLLSQEDSFTKVPTSAIALNPAPKVKQVLVIGTEIAINEGVGSFTLSKPQRDTQNNGVGSVLIAANLGELTADISCLDNHPTTTGAKVPWLRSRNGTCDPSGTLNPSVIWALDPAARASFGVSTPENKATIHVRESFN